MVLVFLLFGVAILSGVLLNLVHKRHRFSNLNKAMRTLPVLIAAVALTSYVTMSLFYYFAESESVLKWARYLDWSITVPMILTVIGIVALPRKYPARRKYLQTMIALALGMIVFGFVSELTQGLVSNTTFVLSSLAYVAIVYILLFKYRVFVRQKSDEAADLLEKLVILSVTAWTLYPLVWLLSLHGFSIIGIEVQTGMYAALDVFSKGGLIAFLLMDVDGLKEADTA